MGRVGPPEGRINERRWMEGAGQRSRSARRDSVRESRSVERSYFGNRRTKSARSNLPAHCRRNCGDSAGPRTRVGRTQRARAFRGTPNLRRPHINRGRDFFITVRADCIFLRLPTTGMSNLENRVEGGPSNHVFPAIGVLRRSSSRHPFIHHHPPLPSPPPARIFILGHNPLLGRTRSPLFDGRRDDRDTGSLPSLPPPLSLALTLFV